MNSLRKTIGISLLLGAAVVLAPHAGAREVRAAVTSAIRDRLNPSAPGSVKIDGYLGKRIDQCIANRLMVQKVEPLLALFKDKTLDTGNYRGEFIGKWLAGAALGCRYQPNPALQQKMERAAAELIESRAANGYISTYKPDAEFKVWDVWIQKYVLLGLIAQYDQSGNQADLEAAKASADHLLSLNGPGKLSVEEYGPSVHKGGVNYSILEPIVLLYERTGERRYLDFARYIVESWSKPSKYTPQGVRLIENAEAGRPLVESDVMHAYVLMSCFEGLAELYRATGEARYLDATVKCAHNIMKYELMITGSVANQEMWCNGAEEQTETMEKPVETCATATWMKLCFQLLRLTGDPQWADQMEISLYNALLGAMMPDGEWWCYESPLTGERVPSRVQGWDLSCCVSSGPRGLLLTPEWGMMSDADGNPVINLFSRGTASFNLANGNGVKITQETEYPVNGLVSIAIKPEKPSSFSLKLRIPQWSAQTVLKVNGEALACTPGSYAVIQRQWQANDKVELELDLRGRLMRAPSGAPQQAIMRGPIVLALDDRLTTEETAVVWLIAHPLPVEGPKKDYVAAKHNFPPPGQQGYIDLEPAAPRHDGILMAFKVPFWQRVGQFTQHRAKTLVLCDYASAGNQWSANNLYRTWFPQPMYLGNIYVKDTYKLMVGRKRTSVPEYIQKAIGKK